MRRLPVVLCLLVLLSTAGCMSERTYDRLRFRQLPDGLYRQPQGVYGASPAEVLGAPDGWSYINTVISPEGGWIERHGYGRTPEEAAMNAGMR